MYLRGGGHLCSGLVSRLPESIGSWHIEEVAAHLGHSTSATSRRYARLSPDGLKRAVRETVPSFIACLRSLCPNEYPKLWRGHRDALATTGNLAEEKGFEPLVELPPTAVSKTVGAVCDRVGLGGDGHGVDTGGVRMAAIGALERMRAGVATTGEVARLAAEVLANPPALMVAARRYLNAVGTEHDGAAAVEFLALLAGAQVASLDAVSRAVDRSGTAGGG